MAAEPPCYTVVFEDKTKSLSMQELRASPEKGTDEDRLDTLRRLLCRRLMGTLRYVPIFPVERMKLMQRWRPSPRS
jgi:coatomer subunit beta